MLKSIVIDNYFEDINEVYNHVKSIKTFDSKNYPNDPNVNTARLDEHKEIDFIHKDEPHMYSMLVYLSPTNLSSGTDLYNENDEVINSVKYVQNRALVFNSSYKHKAVNNHGTDINNGRLTLNIFMDR